MKDDVAIGSEVLVSTGATVSGTLWTSASAGYTFMTPNSSTSAASFTFVAQDLAAPPTVQATTDAVYGYLQAVRALDRIDISVPEIASALSITRPAVIKALEALREKGVKFKS